MENEAEIKVETTTEISGENEVETKEEKPTPKWKKVFKQCIDYLAKTTGGMALGLFATLIVGVIVSQLGTLCGVKLIVDIGNVIKSLMGVGIGIGVALSVKKLDFIGIISAGAAGAIACSFAFDFSAFSIESFSVSFGKNGNPLMAYLVVIAVIELSKLILRKKTPVDIIIVPLLMITLASVISFLLIYPISGMMSGLEAFIKSATEYQPFLMGMVISGVMGMALTSPISSVAIAVAINLDGIAAGAACVGCCVQMVGFMVMSIKDNNIGKVISVGIGTSMLQFKNIVKKPLVWVPTILVSVILGPLSTMVFQLKCNAVGAGMGTCALIGPIQMILAMEDNLVMGWIGMLTLCIIAPIILVFLIDLLFRKLGWIKKGDLEI